MAAVGCLDKKVIFKPTLGSSISRERNSLSAQNLTVTRSLHERTPLIHTSELCTTKRNGTFAKNSAVTRHLGRRVVFSSTSAQNKGFEKMTKLVNRETSWLWGHNQVGLDVINGVLCRKIGPSGQSGTKSTILIQIQIRPTKWLNADSGKVLTLYLMQSSKYRTCSLHLCLSLGRKLPCLAFLTSIKSYSAGCLPCNFYLIIRLIWGITLLWNVPEESLTLQSALATLAFWRNTLSLDPYKCILKV